jgi:hypothetical protein
MLHGEGPGIEAKYPTSDVQPTLTVAWNTVKLKTIENSFKKTGYNCSDSTDMTTDAEIIHEENWLGVEPGSSTNCEEFVKCDDCVITTGM